MDSEAVKLSQNLTSYTLVPRPPLLSLISDFHLSLLLPVLAYWSLSGIYHVISSYNLFQQYRLHTPAELKARNRATKSEVLYSVIFQQVIQTAWGLFLGHVVLGAQEFMGSENYDVTAWALWVQKISGGVYALAVPAMAVLGIDLRGLKEGNLAIQPLLIAKLIYWILVPIVQFSVAVFVSDAWQYFWHRAMHENKWMYRNIHALHHRMHVPYAFGAFYNTLTESFIVDTIGTTISFSISGLSTRQATMFSTISVLKGVDDHSGYQLPWDPLQWINEQTVDFHDVHHQSWGAKTNYSQLYTTFWDHLCGTISPLSKEEKERLYEKGRVDAEKKVQDDVVEQKKKL